MRKHRKEELRKYINWFFAKVKNIDNRDLEILRNLLNAKITCMSHEMKIAPKFNSIIRHIDREDMRESLRRFIDNLIEEKLRIYNIKP